MGPSLGVFTLGGALSANYDTSVTGLTRVLWNGNGAGLGGIDLTQDGGTAFLLDFLSVDTGKIAPSGADASAIGITLIVTTSNGSFYSYSDLVMQEGVLEVAFANFEVPGITSATIFSDINSIELQINTTGNYAPDVSLALIGTNGTCAVVPNPQSPTSPVIDECGICSDQPNFQNAKDDCGYCPDEDNFGLGKDECELCPEDTVTTGSGVFSYQSSTDECNVCFGDNSSCAGCDGIPNSGLEFDECNVCGGDNTSCAGCDGIPNSGLVFDECGVCDGDGSSCAGL